MRVNLENDLFSDFRLRNLQKLLRARAPVDDWETAQFTAIGMLAYLWRESQQELKVECTKTEIDTWIFGGATEIFVASGFIELLENGAYRVRGNEPQVANLQKFVASRGAGGRARASQAARTSSGTFATKEGNQPASHQQATSISPAGNQQEPGGSQQRPAQLQLQLQSQLQDQLQRDINTVAKAPRKKPSRRAEAVGSTGEVLEGKTTSGSRVWEAYRSAMLEAWNMDPPRSAATSSMAKRLVELVGEEEAIKLAAYFPSRRKDFYVRSGHPFKLLVADHMGLLREMAAGIKLTKEIVDDICKKEDTENYDKWAVVKEEKNALLMDDEEREAYFKEREQKELLLERGVEDECF